MPEAEIRAGTQLTHQLLEHCGGPVGPAGPLDELFITEALRYVSLGTPHRQKLFPPIRLPGGKGDRVGLPVAPIPTAADFLVVTGLLADKPEVQHRNSGKSGTHLPASIPALTTMRLCTAPLFLVEALEKHVYIPHNDLDRWQGNPFPF